MVPGGVSLGRQVGGPKRAEAPVAKANAAAPPAPAAGRGGGGEDAHHGGAHDATKAGAEDDTAAPADTAGIEEDMAAAAMELDDEEEAEGLLDALRMEVRKNVGGVRQHTEGCLKRVQAIVDEWKAGAVRRNAEMSTKSVTWQRRADRIKDRMDVLASQKQRADSDMQELEDEFERKGGRRE